MKSDSEKIKNAVELIDKKFDIIIDELSHSKKIDKESVLRKLIKKVFSIY